MLVELFAKLLIQLVQLVDSHHSSSRSHRSSWSNDRSSPTFLLIQTCQFLQTLSYSLSSPPPSLSFSSLVSPHTHDHSNIYDSYRNFLNTVCTPFSPPI